MLAAAAGHFQGLVVAVSEQFGMGSPQCEQFAGHEQFLARVLPVCGKIGTATIADGFKQSAPRVPIDRTAIVRVDQTEIPQLATLIDVGHPRDRQLQDELRQRGNRSNPAPMGQGQGEERSQSGSGAPGRFDTLRKSSAGGRSIWRSRRMAGRSTSRKTVAWL